MFKSKIALKLAVNFVLALVIFSLIISSVFFILFKDYTVEIHKIQLQKYAQTMAEILSANLTHGMHRGAMMGLPLICDSMDMGIWIVDENMNLIMPNTRHFMRHNMHNRMNYQYKFADLPPNASEVINEVFADKTVFSEGFSDVLSQLTLTAGVPVKDDTGKVIGAVLLHSPVSGMEEAVRQGLVILSISIGLALAVVFVLSLGLVYIFTKPLNKMKQVALKLAQGEYKTQCNVVQNDEIGELANVLDLLAVRLDKASQESLKLEQMRKDFISNISHELRTPVTVIRGSLEALCDKIVTEPEKVEQYHRQMLNEAKFLQRLVGDLLDLSRLQNPDFAIEKQSLLLNDVLSDALRSARQIAKAKDIAIDFEQKGPLPLEGDYGRLRQMFLIILDNAVKFSQTGGKVEVIATDKDITVRDYGVGIDEKDLAHIFERFYKTKGEKNKTGTGLGLAIAKQIAARHNIELTATNHTGGGAEFKFKLP